MRDSPIVLLGAGTKFNPISARDQGRVYQLGTTILPEIFMRLEHWEEVGLVLC